MWPHWSPMQPGHLKDMFAAQRRMLEQMERMLDQAGQAGPAVPAHPPVFHDNGDHWLFRAHLPGADKDSVKLQAQNGWLQLQAQSKQQSELKAPGMWQMAHQTGHWHWNLPVPHGVNVDGAKPTWNGDSLELKLPKSK